MKIIRSINKRSILLFLPFLFISIFVTFLSACGNTGKSEINTVDNVIGLPGQTVEVEIENTNNEWIDIDDNGNSEIYTATIIDQAKLSINLIKEGKDTLKLLTESKATAEIKIECIDLKFAFDDVEMGIKDKIEVTFNHSNLDISLELEGTAAVLENNFIVAKEEGEVTLKATYGNIILTRTITIFDKVSEISSFSRNSSLVRYYGRNVHNNGKVMMNNIASGFEVSFKGTRLSATLDGWFGSWYGYTRISVLIDDETDTAKHIVVINKGTTKTEYSLATDLSEGVHKVKVLKRTEALSTSLTLHGLKTDGYFLPADKTRKLRMEAYGDSITAGYGNLRGSLSDTTSSEYQSGLQTYATYTAQLLDAEINVQARSGIGLYTSANIDDKLQVNSGYAYTTYDQEYAWNFDNYVPDVVIINLGTNDYWNNSVFNSDKFISEYVTLVKRLAGLYGEDTSFVLVSGLMEQAVDQFVAKVTSQLISSIPNIVIRYKFNQCKAGHPLYEEHLEAAEKLSEYLTGYGLSVIPEEKVTPEEKIPEATGKTVNTKINVKTADELPSHVNLYLKGLGSNIKLDRDDELNWSTDTSIKEGDYDVKLLIDDNEEYSDDRTSTLHIRESNSEYSISSGTFLNIPEDENPNADTYGWAMSSALFECKFDAKSENNVTYKNPSNWKAAFLTRKTKFADNYTISATIKTSEFTDKTNTYIGLVPYYIDDQNYVMCYLQFNSDNTIRSIGCTGMSDGSDIGWHDFFSFSGMNVDLISGATMTIKRIGTSLTTTVNGKTKTKTISTMTSDNYRVGVWAMCENTIEYSGFTQSQNS